MPGTARELPPACASVDPFYDYILGFVWPPFHIDGRIHHNFTLAAPAYILFMEVTFFNIKPLILFISNLPLISTRLETRRKRNEI